MAPYKTLIPDALYVFYTTDPEDRRVDDAFVGRFLSWSEAVGAAHVEEVRLCPSDDRPPSRRLLTGMYHATPLAPAGATVWEILPRLLVPPEGWPAGIRTVKGLKAEEEAITALRVKPHQDGGVEVDVGVKTLPPALGIEAARLVLQATLAGRT